MHKRKNTKNDNQPVNDENENENGNGYGNDNRETVRVLALSVVESHFGMVKLFSVLSCHYLVLYFFLAFFSF
jgi:hypothetical protein